MYLCVVKFNAGCVRLDSHCISACVLALFVLVCATEYRLISKKGEGTFSEVIKAQSLKNSQYVAIKCMKNQFDSIEQVNNLREIQALRRLSPHSNIIRLLEVL